MARPALQRGVKWKLRKIEESQRVHLAKISELLGKKDFSFFFQHELTKLDNLLREKDVLMRRGRGVALRQWLIVVTNLQKEIGTILRIIEHPPAAINKQSFQDELEKLKALLSEILGEGVPKPSE